MLMKSIEIEAMNLLHDKWVVGIFTFFLIMAGTAYFSQNTMRSSMSTDLVQFSMLSNSDIDNIIAIKAKMQAARIQANLSL